MNDLLPSKRWLAATPSDRTELYFRYTNRRYHAQVRWWSDWREAFQWFEDQYVDWTK